MKIISPKSKKEIKEKCVFPRAILLTVKMGGVYNEQKEKGVWLCTAKPLKSSIKPVFTRDRQPTFAGKPSFSNRILPFGKSDAFLLLDCQSKSNRQIKKGLLMKYYQQSGAIFQGLSDIFISGFNSAGAALGVSLIGWQPCRRVVSR